ncbi:LytTR family DNA-binding domain-containing protein [Mucilaginibacter sp. CSA2-8R]|uniref:LytR/AlgR family response regulator transcription factor n=1 Tax=Mucilaginibacter sp. CSA2-8R TaxID=3141542 RepID=UPI00315D2FE4
MNKLTCYVLDDELHSLETLAGYITQTPEVTLIGQSTDPKCALAAFNAGDVPDILFTDIDMPDLTGLEVSALLGKRCLVIFVTAYNNFAAEAYDSEAFAYLLKPVSYAKFLGTIRRAIEQKVTVAKHEEFLFVRGENKSKTFRVDLKDIVYFESATNYVIVSTVRENITTYVMIKELADHIPEKDFSRIHRSFIINHNHIHYIHGNEVVMTNGSHLPLSSSYKESFLDKINKRTLISKRLL